MASRPGGPPIPAANGAFFPTITRKEGEYGEGKGALVGSLVLDRFLIERRIGSGGFGVVYEAWDGRLERAVAVKAIEQRGEAGKRGMREAQAGSRLNHPGIVTLYEMGEEDGNALLVSELVEGSTLASLSSEDVLSDREIGEIGADLCEALDHGLIEEIVVVAVGRRLAIDLAATTNISSIR